MSYVTGIPADTEYAKWYAGYVALVPETDVVGALAAQPDDLDRLLTGVDDDSSRFRYAPDKWNIRQVVGHLIDGERVFALRALCFSRGEKANLPGFDENAYMANSTYDETPLDELRREFRLLREANVMMLQRLGADAWGRLGVASGYDVSVRALAYIMVGHPRHHMAVIASRYSSALGAAPPAFPWMTGA